MKKLQTLVSIAALLAASAAFAEDKKPAGAAPPAAKPAVTAPTGAEAMPKPPAELDQLGMVGTWKCDGKGMMGGHEVGMKSTYEVTKDLNGFFLVGRTDASEMGYKGVDYYNYDAATKTFVMTSFDNFGTTATATAKAMKGDKQEWNGKGKMMGEEVKIKTTITKKSDNEVVLTGLTTGKHVKDSMEITCKK